ncbi:MAG: hypothetical protein J6Z49_09080 [Kiritimatiellae bacterium]|nr:hypothetical protein [Kiritimatiellia bacterium]
MKNVFLVFLVCFFTTGAFAARPSSRNFRSLADRKAEGQRVEQEKVEAHEETSPQVEVERPEPSEPAEPLEKYVYTGPKKGWGILMEQAPYYTPQGKNLGKLTSGCVFTYDGVRHGSGDRFLFVVTFREPPSPGAPLGPYLLDCDRAAIYGGSPDDASPALVARLSAYYAAHGAAEARRAELAAKRMVSQRDRNPYYRDAKESRRRYNESIDEAARLEKEMNRSQGQRRLALLDELRDLKYRQQGLKAKMDKDTRAYLAWRDANAGQMVGEEELQRDAIYCEYDRKRRELEPSVKRLLPPKRK